MGNCLVTRLKGIVDNPSLHKLGHIDVPVNKLTHIRANATPVSAHVEGGDGLIGGETSLTIPKFAIKVVSGNTGTVYFDRYSDASITISSIEGVDADQFVGHTVSVEFGTINLVNGDLVNYDGKLIFGNGTPTGTVSDLRKYTSLKGLNASFIANNWDWNVYDIAMNLPCLETLESGSNKSGITWNRPSNLPVLCLAGAGGTSDKRAGAEADAYLINMAQCKKGTTYFNIYLTSRTAASDNAVATLEAMGYNIRLKNGVVS